LSFSFPIAMVADPAWTGHGLPSTDGIMVHPAARDLMKAVQPIGDRSPLGVLVILPVTRDTRHMIGDLPGLVRDLRTVNSGALPVLLHDGCDEALLTTGFRAGLFDAVLIGDQSAWTRLLDRAGERLRVFDETSRLGVEQRETTMRLREHKRRLQAQLVRAGDDLARSHERLEQVNLALTEHMDQLSLLYTIGRELSTTPNWDSTLESLLGTMADFVGARGAALVLRPAPGASFAPRQTFQWGEEAWDQVIARLETERRLHGDVHDEPAIITLEPETSVDGETLPVVAALSLEHMHACLGYLLLLDFQPRHTSSGHLAFLRTAQIILAEEVASAQMLDRMRELGTFNSRVLESVGSGIWVLDEMGTTIFCNHGGRELLSGCKQDQHIVIEPTPMIGRGRSADETGPSAAFFRHDTFDLEGLPELFLDALLRLEGIEGPVLAAMKRVDPEPFYGEGRVIRPDGDAVPVMVQSSLMPGRGLHEMWRVVVLEDLRPVKRLAEEKQRADNLESLVEMSATLAHEIRNPLMGLSAQAELLSDSLDEGDDRRRYIDVITGEVDRINDTITRMLQFVRPYEPVRGPVDLDRLVRDCLILVRPRADARDVRLGLVEGAAHDRGATTSADGTQLKQVVLNLLLNAIDAAPETTTVSIALEHRNDLMISDPETGGSRLSRGYRIAVSDQGGGINPDDLEKIFRPFYTTKSAGTGLGLSISRKIVKAHAGTISVHSEETGTKFAILLPDSDKQVSSAQEQEMS
jgi:signal transduction histidine kinase